MALTWNIENCPDFITLKAEGEWHKTEYIIFATMAIDMSEITEDNVTEFYARLKLLSSVYDGSWYTVGVGWEDPTFLDVQRRIGLTTNAYSRNTFSQWLKRIESAHQKTTSRDKLLAAYYSAKVEVEEIMKSKTTHIEHNESFAFDLQARSGA